jgi:hypothetical protein
MPSMSRCSRRGHASGNDAPLDQIDGEVEVTVRPVGATHPTVAEMLALIATFPPGTRSKEDIDRQIAEERASWDRG